jgi:uncharacterized protein YuzE
MKPHFYPEMDSPYIALTSQPRAKLREMADGLYVDLDAVDQAMGLDLGRAATRFGLSRLEAGAQPFAMARAA